VWKRRSNRVRRLALRLGLLALSLCTWPALSIDMAGAQRRQWTLEKCERYKAAWLTLVSRRGTTDLGPQFVESHDAFIASGCTKQADVCPRSARELDVANAMVIAAMNAGGASTFPPFACRT